MQVMVYGCLSSKYLTDLLHLHKPTRSMRSPYTQMLTVPRHNLSFGSRAFRISAPKNWNTLPLKVRQSHSLPTFRNRLKTFCFRSAYPSSWLPVTNAPWFSSRLRRYINYLLTYLLTYLNIYTLVLLYCITMRKLNMWPTRVTTQPLRRRPVALATSVIAYI